MEMPAHCRRVVCKIGGYAEARKAVEAAGVNVLVARVQAGVLAFGRDTDVRAAFSPHGITEFDLHAIEARRLRYDSGERGLLREALSMGLVRELGLSLHRSHGADLLAIRDGSDARWEKLRQLVRNLSGTVPRNPTLRWFEGVSVRLDWADEKPWLLIEPRIVFDGRTPENRTAAADFGRERTVRRYNKQLNDLIAIWAELISQNGAEIRALNIGDGVDAVFRLGPDTAFSRRAQA
jgi:hypothetical protein